MQNNYFDGESDRHEIKNTTTKKIDKSVIHKKCLCLTECKDTEDYQFNKEFSAVWAELRASQQLCDGKIRCGVNEIFPIHRPILSAVSPYFKALFTNRLNASAGDTNEVLINNVPGDIFSLILDYAYTGTCKVTADNVEQLLPLADQFQVEGVVQLCCRFLLQELRPENCLGIYQFAKHYFCHDLAENSRKYIHHNFKKIFQQSSEFREIDHRELITILQDDELNVINEELVFEAIKTWIEVEEEKRKDYLLMLIKCVRYAFISTNYIVDNILSWKLVHDNLACQKFFTTLDINSELLFSRPRIPYEILFAIGGWSGGSPTSFVETYDSRADKWFLSVHTDTVPRIYHGICSLNNLIYVIGGFDGHEYYNTVRCFNPVTKEWQEKACMYYTRCYVSVCVHDGKIYALGGCINRSTRLSTAERYEPECNQWEMIPPMHLQRSDAAAAALNQKVYIVGGINDAEFYRSAEAFDVETNQWTFIRSMFNPRTGLCLVAFRDCLYALGGYDGVTVLISVEKYNPVQEEWQEVSWMIEERCNFSSVVLDDMIYVIGGYDGVSTLTSVECYNPETNEWSSVAPMNLSRSCLSACVITGLPNAKEYSYVSKIRNFGHDN